MATRVFLSGEQLPRSSHCVQPVLPKLAPLLPTHALHLSLSTYQSDALPFFIMWRGSKGGTPIPHNGGVRQQLRGIQTPQRLLPTVSNVSEVLTFFATKECPPTLPLVRHRRGSRQNQARACVLFCSVALLLFCFVFLFIVLCFLFFVFCLFCCLCVFLVCFSFLLSPLSVLASTCPCSVVGCVCARVAHAPANAAV